MIRLALVCVSLQGLLSGCGNDLGFDVSASSGLPCDVQQFLADNCQSCHARPLSAGAPLPLQTYEDLMTMNASGVTAAQRSLDRLTVTAGPQMPPLPAAAAAAADVTMFRAWIAAGAPAGDCPVGGVFGGPAVCTSGQTWSGGNRESPLMHPGAACISCHTSSREGPRFTIAGTIYPTAHEPTDCNGATAAAVEVTDATGRVTTLPANGAGNFSSSTAIRFPIQVAVVAGGKRRAMVGAPSSGDCNTCHSQDGASSAPGRIVAP